MMEKTVVLAGVLALVALAVLAGCSKSRSGGPPTEPVIYANIGAGGSTAGVFDGGGGTEEDPYRISTVTQLAYLSREVNGGEAYEGVYFILVNDLDLNGDTDEWTAIGTHTNRFKGNFNGDSHVIYRLVINKSGDSNQGLFGYIDGARISNLGLEDAAIQGKNGVGCIAGSVNNNSSIENCYSTGTVSGTNNTGGIAGWVQSGSIEDCYSTVAVSGTGEYTGGIAGFLGGGCSISDSYSTGTVSGTNNTGGIAGSVSGGLGSISGSYSTGAVSGTGSYIGGIAGEVFYGSISDCYSTGTVSGSGFGGEVGGIAGYAGDSRISGSYSTGAVSGTGRWVGGGSIENCYSTGTVSGSGVYGGVGGIAGWVAYDSHISGSYSTGAVSETDKYNSTSTGGIAGWVGHGSRISGSYSTGAVSGGGDSGGIAGKVWRDNDANSSSIENCAALNSAVTATNRRAGRIVGFIDGSNTFTGNIAWAGMNNGSGVVFSNNSDKDGAGISTAQVQDGSGLPDGLTSDPWNYNEGKLPILKDLEGQNDTLPGHLR